MRTDNDLEFRRPGWVDEIAAVFARAPEYGLASVKLPITPHTGRLVLLPHAHGQDWIAVEEVVEETSHVGGVMAVSPAAVASLGYFAGTSQRYGYCDPLHLIRARAAGYKVCWVHTPIAFLDDGSCESWTRAKREAALAGAAEFYALAGQYKRGERPVFQAEP